MRDTMRGPNDKPIDIDEVARRNPSVDPSKVRAALESLQALKAQGVSPSQLKIILPFTRTRLSRRNRPR
jgi:hypothetical protein